MTTITLPGGQAIHYNNASIIMAARGVGKSKTALALLDTLAGDFFYTDNGIYVIKPSKQHYFNFYRLNTRITFHDADAFRDYPTVGLDQSDVMAAREWCQANLKEGSYVFNFRLFYFAYDADAVLFKMHWL